MRSRMMLLRGPKYLKFDKEGTKSLLLDHADARMRAVALGALVGVEAAPDVIVPRIKAAIGDSSTAVRLTGLQLVPALGEAGATKLDKPGTIVELLVACGLAKSNGEARRTVNEGGAYLNNERVGDAEHRPQEADLVGGSWLVLRRGKKKIAGVEVR